MSSNRHSKTAMAREQQDLARQQHDATAKEQRKHWYQAPSLA